jgi:hypothetical protein
MHKLLKADSLKSYKKKTAEELVKIINEVEQMRDNGKFPLSKAQMISL